MPRELLTTSLGGGQNIQADLAAVLEDTRRLFDAAATPGEAANSIVDLIQAPVFPATAEGGSGWLTVTSGVSVFGAYVEVVAALSAATLGLIVGFYSTQGDNKYTLKFATGGAGSEVDKFFMGVGRGAVLGSGFYVPFILPSGARLSVAVNDDSAVARAHSVHVEVLYG